jgi:hypothetical protein
MIRTGVGLVLAVATAWFCTQPSPAMGQNQLLAELSNPNITSEYYEPRDPTFLPLYERLQKRQVLEQLGQFLGPAKWPKKLRLIMKQCPSQTPEPQVYYSAIEYSINLCYQWFATINGFGRPRPTFASHAEVIVGGVVGIVLHEAGRAIFDMLKVPRLGSDDDAADQITSFVALQFNKDVARTVIKGTFWVWDTYDYRIRNKNEPYNFAGRSSVAPQRVQNTACIAYGGDPDTFKPLFLDTGLLAPVRAPGCAAEYKQAHDAFDKTIKRHVDLDLMKKVQSITWLSSEDLN